ncbi:MAG: TlpA disulfide reductase family protein [Pseudomonadales bacterium]|nr:TlpA disulfide reductase family protein [Pseudomonadales bacterium]
MKSSKTKWFFVLTVLVALCSCNAKNPDDTSGAADGASAAQVSIATVSPKALDGAATFQDLQGKPLDIAGFAGKKVFLNYWATWCAPCIREIPAIARAAAILEDEGFVFLLASDEPVEEIRAFVEEQGFTGNFIKLNQYFSSHGVQAVPSSVLYDAQGQPIRSWLGAYEWDSPEILAQLRAP